MKTRGAASDAQLQPQLQRKAQPKSQPNLRLAAAHAVMDVVDHGRSLDDALATHGASLQTQARAWFHEMCYGACRHYHYFDAILARLLNAPLKARDRAVHFILINACYQLEHMRTPDYAAVDESVEAVKGSRFSWADKMINGVLRNFLKRRAELHLELAPDSARFAFPPWLYREIRAHWPDHFRAVFEASNRKPPLTLRVNQLKISRDAYLELLSQAGVAASPTAHGALGVTLENPLPTGKIPGFADGLVSVQDESAQLAAAVLPLAPGERVLDGCAAPGGKTCVLLEAEPKLAAMVAVDLPGRIDAVADNLARLGLNADGGVRAEVSVVAGDLTAPEAWWDGRLFERILLDVPCSGSGIIRRHPDIKHRRRPEDVAKFARRQFDLLSKAWSLLGNGGTLLYVTCSVLPAENDAVIEKFLTGREHARAETIDAPPGIATRFGRQRLPGVHPGDGFYYCHLKNTAQSA